MQQSPFWEANKYPVSQKKNSPFYNTQSFITMFTSARHLSLSRARSIQSMLLIPLLESVLILSSQLSLRSKGTFQVRGSVKFSVITVNFFCGKQLLVHRPKPKLEDHPLSAVRDCLFNVFAATLPPQSENAPRRGDCGPSYHESKRRETTIKARPVDTSRLPRRVVQSASRLSQFTISESMYILTLKEKLLWLHTSVVGTVNLAWQRISPKINKHEPCLLSSPACKSWQETTTFTYTELRTVMDPTAGNVCNIQRNLLLQLLYEHTHTANSLIHSMI
jgi:hypothetical protein